MNNDAIKLYMSEFDWSFMSFAEGALERYEEEDKQGRTLIKEAIAEQIEDLHRLLILLDENYE